MAKIKNYLNKMFRRCSISKKLEKTDPEEFLHENGWMILENERLFSTSKIIFVHENELGCCPFPHHFNIGRYYGLYNTANEFKKVFTQP